MDNHILYVVTVEGDLAASPHYEEDREVLEKISGVPCRRIHYTQLDEVLPELGEGWTVVQSGGRAGPKFPNEPVLRNEGYRKLAEWDGPQLAICRSFQLVSALHGSEVRPMPFRDGLEVREAGNYESGPCLVHLDVEDPLFEGLPEEITVHQNHRNEVVVMPEGFTQLASADSCPLQAWKHNSRLLYGTQFHPERGGHPHGIQILRNFFRLAIGH
jgi:GMP synthase-like glutamine amidotransferase